MLSLNHHSEEQDYWDEQVDIETSSGEMVSQQIYLLRVYPTTFGNYDAYMDMPQISPIPTLNRIYSPRLGITWIIAVGPLASPINGSFRGDNTSNNPPAWLFGLRKND